MRGNVFKMTFRRGRTALAVWSLAMAALVVLGLLFYPVITENMYMLSDFLENPMMKTMLSAFGADINAMMTLEGFFSTYGSIYMLLIGCIYAVIGGIQMIAGEERDGTLEFLLTRPVSRRSIYVQKTAALLLQIAILNAVVFFSAWACFAGLSSQAQYRYIPADAPLTDLIRDVRNHPSDLDQVYKWDDDLFMGWAFGSIQEQLPKAQEGLDELGIDASELEPLLEKMMDDPEGLLDEIEANPEKWMTQFGIPTEERASFLAEMKRTRQVFYDLKKQYYTDPTFRGELFSQTPEVFLGELTAKVDVERFMKAFPASQDAVKQLLRPYRVSALGIMSLFSMLVMWSFAGVSVLVTLLLRKSRGLLGLTLGFVLVSYFLDTLSDLAPVLSPLGWISLFHYVDWNAVVAGQGINIVHLIVLSVVTAAAFGVGALRFESRNIAA